MNFERYQKEALKTADYPDIGNNFIYPTLGLTGEAGEVSEKVKKIMRDDNGIMSPEKRDEIIKELGDVLWYIAAMSSELKVTLEEVAIRNIVKLQSRRDRNKIRGSGDNR